MKKIKFEIKKALLILPLLAIIITTNVLAKQNKQIKTQFGINNNITKIIINKNTTNKQFGKIINDLNEKKITAEFKNISRNDQNEIIAIDITITKNNSSSSFSANSNNAISEIEIIINNEDISINNNGLFAFNNNKTDIDKEVSKLLQNNSQFFQNFGSQTHIDLLNQLMQQHQSFFNQLNSDDEQQYNNNINNIFKNFFSQIQNGINNNFDATDFNLKEKTESTYIVNGKKMSKEEYLKMDKSKIKQLEIKKETVKSYKKN